MVIIHLGSISSIWGWFGGQRRSFGWAVVFQGICFFGTSNILILSCCGFISLGWGGCPGKIQGVPPFQAVYALGGNAYPILAFDTFGFL